MTPATAKTPTRKSPRKPATAKPSNRKSTRKPAIAKASTRKMGNKRLTKAARNRPAASRITRKLAPVSTETVASQLACISAVDTAAAKMKFEQGILARGEAVRAGKPLPAGATHVIIEETPDGSLILKRKRFSMT